MKHTKLISYLKNNSNQSEVASKPTKGATVAAFGQKRFVYT
jgi:hypothetical protein